MDMAKQNNLIPVDRMDAPHSKQSLRLWLKLLGCTTVVEKRLRARMDADFSTTLPRFDVLAALERHPEGLKMSALSEFLMVSNGNVTGVITRLIEEGFVTRTVDHDDRRSATGRLTRKGRDEFLKMAAANEIWMDTMFSDLSDRQIEDLMRLLGHLRHSIDAHLV